ESRAEITFLTNRKCTEEVFSELFAKNTNYSKKTSTKEKGCKFIKSILKSFSFKNKFSIYTKSDFGVFE
ncbi:MAG: hypothetical protein ABR566_10275, partial [Pyrinomonadaceae bacterium]